MTTVATAMNSNKDFMTPSGNIVRLIRLFAGGTTEESSSSIVTQ
jgi:hypothetical protein